jgi:hypothetical protein
VAVFKLKSNKNLGAKKVHDKKDANLKVGMSCLTKRFHYLNGKIPLCWLNMSFLGYKIP